MDWKKIKDAMNPYINKAKEYGQKTVGFVENQVQTTPLFIKNQADYDDLLTEKRVVIIAYDDTKEIAKDIQLYSTIWMTRAFIDMAKCRFLSINEFPNLTHDIGFSGPIDMQVQFEGTKIYRFTNIDDIKEWWKSPTYKGDTEKTVSVKKNK